jgi:stage III sporulation protein AD
VSAVALAGFALVAVVALVVLRTARPELATILALAVTAAIFAAILPEIIRIVQLLRDLANQGGVAPDYLGTVLRIVGVAYLTEFGAQVARDAGEGAVASKVELGGKVLVLTMALPILLGILQLVVHLLT